MPYIGNTAANRFVASKAASVYSGDGSTTAFTLEHSVGADEDILVSVDGVVQEPSVAYAVSNGTTLTFTAAPSSNSGNNIFVYYLFRTVGTIDHPATSALSATSGTFSTTLDVTGDVTIGGSATTTAQPTLAIVDTTNGAIMSMRGQSPKIHFDVTSSGVPKILMDNAGAEFKSGTLDAEGDVHLKIDSTGAITKPLQPAFQAQMSQNLTNFSTGTDHTVVFNSEVYDTNSDYNTSNYTFTAPVDGKYQFNCTLYLQSIDTAATYYQMKMVTTGATYNTILDPKFSSDVGYYSWSSSSLLLSLDANDTVKMQIKQTGGTAQTDIDDNPLYTNFIGYLVA